MRRSTASRAISCTIVLLAFVVFRSNATLAAIVYDNTTTSTGVINDMLTAATTNSLERGNMVTLAGVERIVQQFDVRLRSAGPGVSTFDKRLRFYQNDGPGGAPGSLIWDSGASPTLIDSGADLNYSFAVPDVLVPNSFTWTLQLTNRAGVATTIGPVEYAPVTIGSATNGYWENNAGNWQFTGTNAPFGARITAAVPEPAGLALLAVIACAMARRGR